MNLFFDTVGDDNRLLLEWEVCLERLKVDDSQVRKDAAANLRLCVERAVREVSTESFEKFEAELHQRVFNLLNGKVGCVLRVARAMQAETCSPLCTRSSGGKYCMGV